MEYTVNERPYTSFLPILQELSFDPQKNYGFDLSYLSTIEILGERSNEFLQGQLTCDVREVQNHQMRQAALCNLKGRILALMDVINLQTLHLVLPEDLVADTTNNLAKVASFSRVTVKASASWSVFGFYLQNPNDFIPMGMHLPTEPFQTSSDDDYYCYYLGQQLYIVLIKNNISSFKDYFLEQNQWRGSLAWHALSLKQLRAEIYPKTRGLFLTHRLGLQLSGHISFNKGCYKGQEIIARTHYRAKLKHKMLLFTMQSDQALLSGQAILNQENIEVGEIIDYCPIEMPAELTTPTEQPVTYLIAASMIFNPPSKIIIGTTYYEVHYLC